MSGASRAAEVALLVIGPVIFAAAVDPPTAKHEIAARKMLYPQREYSEWQTYPVRTVHDIQPKPKAVALDRFGGGATRAIQHPGSITFGKSKTVGGSSIQLAILT
jgi:hypothetical protein